MWTSVDNALSPHSSVAKDQSDPVENACGQMCRNIFFSRQIQRNSARSSSAFFVAFARKDVWSFEGSERARNCAPSNRFRAAFRVDWLSRIPRFPHGDVETLLIAPRLRWRWAMGAAH